MPDFRSFAPSAEPDSPEIVLSSEESHHLVRVNRARFGDPVVAFNGCGLEWTCKCIEPDGKQARLRVLSQRQIPPRTPQITIAQALPKGKGFESIIQKATELGVVRIFPILTSRTETKLSGERRESRHSKWKTTAIEAAKQSGNSYLPKIEPLQSLDGFLAKTGEFDLRLIGSLQPEAASLRPAVERFIAEKHRPPSTPVWLIGPEGDFDELEYQAAAAHGFVPVSFGRLVLRCETAVTCALSILNYELDNR